MTNKVEQNIYKELNSIFSKLSVPAGQGYYIGNGDEPVFVVYLPYEDDVTGRAEDKIAQITYRLKVDIIARNGASFTKVEDEIQKLLEDNGYIYRNGEAEAETKEPYNFHRVLYYNKLFYHNELAPKNI